MKRFPFARIEMVENGCEPAGGNILPHGESRQAHQLDAGKRQTAKALAIADLHTSYHGNDDGLATILQRPAIDRPAVTRRKAIMSFEIGNGLRPP